MARNALGRGLSALIREPGLVHPEAAGVNPDGPGAAAAAVAPALAAPPPVAAAPAGDVILQIDVDMIDPSPHQPRKMMKEDALEELAQSINVTGIIQPVLVRRTGNRYELIAGERRWRAAQRAGMQRVPAVIRDVNDEQAMELTLIENLQRENLNPMEEAFALDRLMHEFGMTQDQVSERTGKSRSAISNSLRLLRLDPRVGALVARGEVSLGHAKAIAGVIDPVTQFEIAQQVVKGKLSVRQIERMTYKSVKQPVPGTINMADPNVRHMLGLMEQKYGTKVVVKPFVGGKGGQLIFYYYENEFLGTLYDMLMVEH